MHRQSIKNLRIALRPDVVDDDLPKTPFLAVARQLAIVAIHQKRILGPRAWTFARHEMLRHHITVDCGRIFADLDLKIAHGVTRIERTEQGDQRIDDRLATSQFGEIETELPARRAKIENAIFGQRR